MANHGLQTLDQNEKRQRISSEHHQRLPSSRRKKRREATVTLMLRKQQDMMNSFWCCCDTIVSSVNELMDIASSTASPKPANDAPQTTEKIKWHPDLRLVSTQRWNGTWIGVNDAHLNNSMAKQNTSYLSQIPAFLSTHPIRSQWPRQLR